jgi:hypothetical protein
MRMDMIGAVTLILIFLAWFIFGTILLVTTSMFSTKYKLFFRHLSVPIFYFQLFPSSFHRNRGYGVQTSPKYAPKKMRTSSKVAYSHFATDGGLHHG